MIITYHGHACFKIKGGNGTLVTDPYQPYVGFELPSLTADIITVSHDNPAHNNYRALGGTARRKNPFLIEKPGEYEVLGISVFGVKSFQDDQAGALRGVNNIFTVLMDGLRVCHLGGLGHVLDEATIGEIGLVDVLFLPVGEYLGLSIKDAIKVARSLEPNIVIPMSYRLPNHDQKVFGEMKPVEEFLKIYETEVQAVDCLSLTTGNLPEEMEVMLLNCS